MKEYNVLGAEWFGVNRIKSLFNLYKGDYIEVNGATFYVEFVSKNNDLIDVRIITRKTVELIVL